MLGTIVLYGEIVTYIQNWIQGPGAVFLSSLRLRSTQ